MYAYNKHSGACGFINIPHCMFMCLARLVFELVPKTEVLGQPPFSVFFKVSNAKQAFSPYIGYMAGQSIAPGHE
jgi:hypothetical protein